MTPKRASGSNLLTLGSAAVMAVYAAGYVRTKPAADLLAAQEGTGRGRDGGRESGREVPDAPRDVPVSLGDASAPVASAAAAPVTLATVQSLAAAPTNAGTLPAAPRDSAPPKQASASAAAKSSDVVAQAAPPALKSGMSITIADTVITLRDSATKPVVAEKPVDKPVEKTPEKVAEKPVEKAPEKPAPTTPVVPAPAAPAPAAPAPAAAAAATRLKDGMFLGRGTSRHGDIEAMVEVVGGRVVSAVISQCLTRYSCSWIASLPPQVVARQSPDVDNVSGATESANAFYFAIKQALQQAK